MKDFIEVFLVVFIVFFAGIVVGSLRCEIVFDAKLEKAGLRKYNNKTLEYEYININEYKKIEVK